MALISSSSAYQVNWTDVRKSIRAGSLVLVSTFALAVVQAGPALLTPENLANPKGLMASLALAGATAVFDLIRRFLTNYASA